MGKVKLHLLLEIDVSGTRGQNISEAVMKHGFAIVPNKIADDYMTFHIEKDLLMVEVCTIYKDNRPHQHYRCEFKKAE